MGRAWAVFFSHLLPCVPRARALRATRTSAACAQACERAGHLRVVDEEFELLLLLKGVVHLNLLFEHQVVLDDCSADSGCFGRLQFGQPLAKPDERVCRGLPSERAVCVCEAVSVEKGARRRPLPAAIVCPPAGRQLAPCGPFGSWIFFKFSFLKNFFLGCHAPTSI